MMIIPATIPLSNTRNKMATISPQNSADRGSVACSSSAETKQENRTIKIVRGFINIYRGQK